MKNFKNFANKYTKNIKKCLTLKQIVDKIENNDYNAEMIIQHLIIHLSKTHKKGK
jgi:hypothetical protein